MASTGAKSDPPPEAEAGFPRIYAVAKWTVITLLVILSIIAAAFWTMLLGQFSASGFRAQNPSLPSEDVVVTPECAWPYRIDEPEAKAVCRMFYHLSPKQREQALRARK